MIYRTVDYLLFAASIATVTGFTILAVSFWVLHRARKHLKREREILARRQVWDKRDTLSVIDENYRHWVNASIPPDHRFTN